MRYILIVLRFITYLLALSSLFFGFGEVVVLYIMSSTSLVPYAEGSGKSTFGLWYFLAVLIVGGIAGLSSVISILSILMFKRKVLLNTTLMLCFLAGLLSIIDCFLPLSLRPLGISSIDALFITLFISYLLCFIVSYKNRLLSAK
jgi:hypothetical protein